MLAISPAKISTHTQTRPWGSSNTKKKPDQQHMHQRKEIKPPRSVGRIYAQDASQWEA